MNKAYINGTGCISPQNTADETWFFETVTGNDGCSLKAMEPSYKDYISPNMLRRMGRAIKMGVGSAHLALNEAKLAKVDAITTGTGLGCFEDSERFLLAMLNNDEQFLTPTSFIQSTHNTVGSQIALILKCHDYNFTYVHRGFSFESAVLDAMMLFEDGKEHVLVGGIEEHTPIYVELNRQAGKLKELDAAKPFWDQQTKGFQMGEGGAFFALSKHRQERSLAVIDAVGTLYKPKTSKDVLTKLNAFLERNGLSIEQIDLVLMGFSSDAGTDAKLKELLPVLSPIMQVGYFKHLCGEYHTASAFATWLATQIIRRQQIPEAIKINDKPVDEIKHTLILNQYLDNNYSFIVVSQC